MKRLVTPNKHSEEINNRYRYRNRNRRVIHSRGRWGEDGVPWAICLFYSTSIAHCSFVTVIIWHLVDALILFRFVSYLVLLTWEVRFLVSKLHNEQGIFSHKSTSSEFGFHCSKCIHSQWVQNIVKLFLSSAHIVRMH